MSNSQSNSTEICQMSYKIEIVCLEVKLRRVYTKREISGWHIFLSLESKVKLEISFFFFFVIYNPCKYNSEGPGALETHKTLSLH